MTATLLPGYGNLEGGPDLAIGRAVTKTMSQTYVQIDIGTVKTSEKKSHSFHSDRLSLNRDILRNGRRTSTCAILKI